MKILILSGKKQSGKDTTVEFLTEQGIPVKRFSFAEDLKKFCVDVLGVKYECIYGTDAQKNELTHLKWEDMPGVVTPEDVKSLSGFETGGGSNLYWEIEEKHPDERWCSYWDHHIDDKPTKLNNRKWIFNLIIHEPGPMTGREVMQYVGSDICRRIYGDCWVSNTWRRIENWYSSGKLCLDFDGRSFEDVENTIVALTDCRFPNEVSYLSKHGAKSIRFKRQIDKDNHLSEIALDNYTEFDYIIDNTDMSLDKKNNKVMEVLMELNWV